MGYVYRYRTPEPESEIVYVGKAKCLEDRTAQHKKDPWYSDELIVERIDAELNATDADIYETYFINLYHPRENKAKIWSSPMIKLQEVQWVPVAFSIPPVPKPKKPCGVFCDRCGTYAENYSHMEFSCIGHGSHVCIGGYVCESCAMTGRYYYNMLEAFFETRTKRRKKSLVYLIPCEEMSLSEA